MSEIRERRNKTTNRRARDRREVRDFSMAAADQMATLRARCGDQWPEALAAAENIGIQPGKFSSDDFDCRHCPFFMACLTSNHFDNNSGWRYDWIEDHERKRTRKPTEETVNP